MLNDTVNALVPHTLKEPIRGADSGPLSGRTFVSKDLLVIAGHRIANGNPAWYATHEPSDNNAAAVQLLLDAGADCTGIAICDEFFYSLLGTNVHYGAPRNARAEGRVTGGSSCGSAAAVAAGLCDFSLGSDTGGSVRVPASFCGLYGLRPTHGRIDSTGVTRMAPSFDTVGHFADDAALFRAAGRVLLNQDAVEDEIERLIIATDAFDIAETAVAKALAPFVERLREMMPHAQSMVVAGSEADRWRDAFRVLQAGEVKENLVPFVQSHDAQLGPGIKQRFAMAAAITPEEIDAARPVREAARERMSELVTPGTVIALPAAPVLPPFISADGLPEHEEFRRRTQQITCWAGLAGLPQMSVPGPKAEGCPVGLSLIGWAGGDEALLDLAVKLEAMLRG